MRHEIVVPIAVNNRHVHLSKEDAGKLFGPSHELTQEPPNNFGRIWKRLPLLRAKHARANSKLSRTPPSTNYRSPSCASRNDPRVRPIGPSPSVWIAGRARVLRRAIKCPTRRAIAGFYCNDAFLFSSGRTSRYQACGLTSFPERCLVDFTKIPSTCSAISVRLDVSLKFP